MRIDDLLVAHLIPETEAHENRHNDRSSQVEQDDIISPQVLLHVPAR